MSEVQPSGFVCVAAALMLPLHKPSLPTQTEEKISPLKRTFAISQGFESLADCWT